MIRFIPILLFVLLGLAFDNHAQTAPKSPQTSPQLVTGPTIETGKFQFYETRQIRGEETYEVVRAANGDLILTSKIDLPFAEQEKKPAVNATLRMKHDFTPKGFEIKGPTLLEIEENTKVVIQAKTASVQDRGPEATVELPRNSFTLSGYVPLAMEMMLVRYWLTHRRPGSIRLLPNGEALVELRGKDRVIVAGKPTVLSRYHLSGKNWRGGWGRQTLWLDSEDRLVAAVNLGSDIETNLYAFRDGYESSQSFFLKRTVEDAIDRLTKIADRLSPKTPSPLVLTGATLIDVTGKPPIANSAVVIEGDRILSVGPRATAKIPSGAKVVDVSGRFLLPGLWDMHSHFYQVEFGPTYLAAGITSARDVGNDIEFGTSMRDAAKQKRGLGPRMLLAGYIDGKSDYHSFDVQVETPEEARAAVQRYKNAGYELIKIRDQVKLETLKVITAEAHRLGMRVVGHIPDGMNALQAVEAGMDEISHLNYVETGFFPNRARNNPPVSINLESANSKRALEFFKKHGTVVDPTIAVLELMLRPKNVPIESFEAGVTKVAPELVVQINMKGESADQAAGLRAVLDVMLKIIGGLHRAGVPIVAGTDVGVPAHTLHRELELYVKAGLTPLEAIQAATITPARAMKVDNEVGTIEPGKRADLMVLDANPLDNISNIRRVRYVIAQGRLFDSAKLWESVGFKP